MEEDTSIMFGNNDHSWIMTEKRIVTMVDDTVIESRRIQRFINNEYWSFDGIRYLLRLNELEASNLITGNVYYTTTFNNTSKVSNTFLFTTRINNVILQRPLLAFIPGNYIYCEDDTYRILDFTIDRSFNSKIIICDSNDHELCYVSSVDQNWQMNNVG